MSCVFVGNRKYVDKSRQLPLVLRNQTIVVQGLGLLHIELFLHFRLRLTHRMQCYEESINETILRRHHLLHALQEGCVLALGTIGRLLGGVLRVNCD